MSTSQMSAFLQHLRATLDRDAGEVRDGELLTRFLKQRDDTALAALVHRHAQMVWGVCCRLLRNRHDAEDAFQATFLVLVRKAATVQDKELVANWLYGVAHQTAVRLKALAAKQSVREKQVMDIPEHAQPEARVDDLMPLLDQELSRLPEQFRALIVLCDLEGKTRKEAAQQLGCPEGTVASRLVRARALLAKRFARHGVAISGASLAVALSTSAASASAPASVVISTIKAASLLATGQAAATGLISAKVVAVTEGVVKAMFVSKIKSVLSMVFVGGMVLGGVGAGVGLSNGSAVALADGPAVVTQEFVALAEQPAPAEAEKAQIEEKLRRLLQQLEELEAKKAARPGRPAVPPTPGRPAVPGDDDATFLRRVTLDLVGRLPTEDETKAFLADKSADKRQKRINELLDARATPPVDPAIAALEGLLKSTDPKVVVQAKELLVLLAKKRIAGSPMLAVVPDDKATVAPSPAPKTGPLSTLKLESGKFELQLDVDVLKPYGLWLSDQTTTKVTAGTSALKLSADGKYAVVVSADGTIRIYEVATGKELIKFFAKSVDDTIRIYDMSTGKQQMAFPAKK